MKNAKPIRKDAVETLEFSPLSVSEARPKRK
jgi:hypothetical protein